MRKNKPTAIDGAKNWARKQYRLFRDSRRNGCRQEVFEAASIVGGTTGCWTLGRRRVAEPLASFQRVKVFLFFFFLFKNVLPGRSVWSLSRSIGARSFAVGNTKGAVR